MSPNFRGPPPTPRVAPPRRSVGRGLLCSQKNWQKIPKKIPQKIPKKFFCAVFEFFLEFFRSVWPFLRACCCVSSMELRDWASFCPPMVIFQYNFTDFLIIQSHFTKLSISGNTLPPALCDFFLSLSLSHPLSLPSSESERLRQEEREREREGGEKNQGGREGGVGKREGE